jgi:4-aminobutyrate aminotransferase-like enzyme
VIAFEGAYHGLGYGALNATHREHFRGPFRSQLGEFGHFVPYPPSESAADQLPAIRSAIETIIKRQPIGAILVEPMQARGGIRIPPPEFLPMLRDVSHGHGVTLILDEIYTGFGRTGEWFACEHGCVVPDIICLGKALTGGFPLSACVGRSDLMDAAWPPSDGEAIHTSTFLGHPVGCAMALANLEEIRNRKLVEHCEEVGRSLLRQLRVAFAESAGITCRGIGLMAAIELRREDGRPATEWSLRIVKEMLRRGFILLPEGEHANVVGFTPPLTITEREIKRTVDTFAKVVKETSP